MSNRQNRDLRVQFDRRVKLKFLGSKVMKQRMEDPLFTMTAVVAFVVLASAVGCSDAPQSNESLGDSSIRLPYSPLPPISNEELQVFGTHISPTISAEFTADGKWIVVSGRDGITIHDASTTECVQCFNGELVEVSPDGATFLLDYPNGPPELRSIPDGRLLWRIPEDVATQRMHFSDDGQYLVCGYRSLLRVETKKVVYRAPVTYSFDTIYGGDTYRDLADRPVQEELAEDTALANLSLLPYIYRTTLRHDDRPLITLKSGLCSPAGRFMILQTDEDDDSFEPYYSFVDRENGSQLFSNVPTSESVFFHDDKYVFFGSSVYETTNGKPLFTIAGEVTAASLNADETMLAVGWRSGQIALVNPITGEERFRLAVEDQVDTRRRKSGEIVSLALSNDSTRLAAVGRKLSVIDIPSQRISEVLNLGRGSREVGDPETTSPAGIVFNQDGSRLLLTGRQQEEYIYSRPRAFALESTDLAQRRHFCSADYFDRSQKLLPAYFNSDGTYAIMPKDGRGRSSDHLQLWDTDADEAIADIEPQAFQWRYRRRVVVPDFPKRHLGLGHFRNWYADEITMYPWSLESIESSKDGQLPDGGKAWLKSFVRTNPHCTSRSTNGQSLDLPSRQWMLRFRGGRLHQLYDLSTGEIYPPDGSPPTYEQIQNLDSEDVPEKCWGLAVVEGNAFSADGSRLLVYCRRSQAKNKHLLAMFEMPSGKLIRSWHEHAFTTQLRIAPNNRIAAISTDDYNKTWIIDLETGETLVELPVGGKCVFSPDSRYAQVGDRYGKSQSLLTIATGRFIGFQWADRWSFCPNSRYALGGTWNSWYFVDLATAERTWIPGSIRRTGMQTLTTTRLILPHRGSRLLCAHEGKTKLYDASAAKCIADFDPLEIAKRHAAHDEKAPSTYVPLAVSQYFYTPDDQNFVYLVGGSNAQQESSNHSRMVPEKETTEYSTQVLIGDLETGQQIQCDGPNWSRCLLQHKLFTPDGTHLVTISAEKVACWKLHPLALAWETELASRWTDPETGAPYPREETLGWSLGYSIHPNDQSILIAADGREAILISLATGKEEQRFGPLPINSVLRFGTDGEYLQIGFRANRSMRLYDVLSGNLVRAYHFANEGSKLHRFDPLSVPDRAK